MEKTGYLAYEELKNEFGDDDQIFYSAFNSLCVEKKDVVGRTITKQEIQDKANKMRKDKEEKGATNKAEEKQEKESPLSPHEFASAVLEGKLFETPDGKVITIVAGPSINGDVTGITSNGEQVKANAKYLRLADGKGSPIKPEETLEAALEEFDNNMGRTDEDDGR